MALRVLRTLGTCPLFPTPPFPNADIHPAPDDFAAIMISPESYRAILSGQRRDLLAVAARGMLSVAEVPYRAAMACRNRRYERGWAEIHRVSVPVVSVGNLTVGGTGKTPFVAWLAQWFRDQGIRVSLVSRGYGGQTGGGNDEARELEQRLPDVPHVQSPDRVAAARIAIDELATQLIILDDGFQHRRIGRDLDVVLIDATQPFGYGHVLPRGLMRESKRGLSRADVVALTRAISSRPPSEPICGEKLNGWHPTPVGSKSNSVLRDCGLQVAKPYRSIRFRRDPSWHFAGSAIRPPFDRRWSSKDGRCVISAPLPTIAHTIHAPSRNYWRGRSAPRTHRRYCARTRISSRSASIAWATCRSTR